MSDPNAPQPSADRPQGWYPNAEGKQQWWDGTTWGKVKPDRLVVWALVLGLVGLAISLIPFAIFFGFWVAAAGGVLGIVAVVRKFNGRPQAIAAIIAAGLAIVLGSVITGAVAGTLPRSSLAGSTGDNSGTTVAVSSPATPIATPTPTPTPTTPPAPVATAGETQALLAAQGYLASGIGFSQAGLLDQLTSSSGNGFEQADAQWAIDQIAPDWNSQAVISAKGYMASGIGFSRSSLIEQLSSASGSQFTAAQAAYAADQVGLK